MSERVAYYAALAAEGPHGHDATCPAYGVPSRQCMCGEDEREFLRRDVPALLAELEAALAEQAKLTRERDDAWEARDAWHARVAHIAQALGMQPPPSGDWRDVVFAEVEQAVAAQRRELEAARAVVEACRRMQLHSPATRWALNKYDAAKAGKAVE